MSDISLFKDVDKFLLKNVDMIKKKYTKGSTVYEKGIVCNSLDIVLSGDLVAYAASANGSESRVFSFEKDNTIGANLLFGNINRYPFNIYATTNCELLHINKDAVEALLKDYEFTLNFVKILSLNSQVINQKIAIYTQKTLRENLMDYFSTLSLQQNSRLITLSMSKKQLADYLGVQRPSLFRELKKMQDEGLIFVSNKEIQLIYRE